jgi:hypothetical protein
MTNLIAGLAIAVTFGGMTFFSSVMAPLIFTKLPAETAGAFIRAVFPWYYLTLGATTLVALLALLPGIAGSTIWEAVLTAGVLVGFLYSRQVLMPRINEARDAELAGEQDAARRFQRLHRASVAVNAIQWLGALLVLAMMLT